MPREGLVSVVLCPKRAAAATGIASTWKQPEPGFCVDYEYRGLCETSRISKVLGLNIPVSPEIASINGHGAVSLYVIRICSNSRASRAPVPLQM